MNNLWNTTMVENESILMLRDANGRTEAPLLYKPLRVLSVQNLAKGKVYEEGRDYTVENGEIVLTDNSRIFAFTAEELYPAQGEAGRSFAKPDGFVLFSEGPFFIERQIAVTYICEPGQWKGVIPTYAKQQLPRILARLRSGEDCHILLYGDSISEGANNTKGLNIPPYQPDFGTLMHQALCKHYKGNIRFTNTSVGGKEMNWAIENVEENVNRYQPDLVIVGFGMNDGNKTPEQFEERMRTLIGRIRANKAETEMILIATSLPNALLTDPRAHFWGYQEQYLSVLERIAADTEGVAVANITDVHRELLKHKRFIDLTSNNVNHPNDFFYRWHAEYLAAMLIPQEED